MSSLGIVGGGFLGMTLALRLRQAGLDVDLFEAAPTVGGLASPHEIDGITWDRFYHVILLSDSNLLSLLDELGLKDRIEWKTTRTGFYTDGELHSMSNAWEFLTFPALNLLDKVRLGATILRASRVRNWKALESVSATDWLRKWSGERAFKRIWLPLLKSKLGENYSEASAAFIWAIVARLYAARRSGLKEEMFGYVRGGYGEVLKRFEARLEEEGVTLHLPVRVAEIGQNEQGAFLVADDGKRFEYDGIVLTLSAPRIPNVVPQLSESEVARLERVVYQGVVCLSLLLKRPLGGFYVTNITEPWVPFTGVIEMTALVDKAVFGGRHLVYLPKYLAQDDPSWKKTDGEIRREFIRGLEGMYSGFSREEVVASRVARAREVQAISTLHYSRDALPPLETSLDLVFIANSAQIVAGTLNLNETVGLAQRQSSALTRRFSTSEPLKDSGRVT